MKKFNITDKIKIYTVIVSLMIGIFIGSFIHCRLILTGDSAEWCGAIATFLSTVAALWLAMRRPKPTFTFKIDYDNYGRGWDLEIINLDDSMYHLVLIGVRVSVLEDSNSVVIDTNSKTTVNIRLTTGDKIGWIKIIDLKSKKYYVLKVIQQDDIANYNIVSIRFLKSIIFKYHYKRWQRESACPYPVKNKR